MWAAEKPSQEQLHEEQQQQHHQQQQEQQEQHEELHHDGASSASGSSCSSEANSEAAAESEEQPLVTLYTVLGVSITASAESIRAAYRRLARLWHPDRNGGDKHNFQLISGAYEVLSDTSRRHHYDLNLLEHLDVEEYLARYQGLILTACGLGMSSRENSLSDPLDTPPGTPSCHPARTFSVGSPAGSYSGRSGWCGLLKAS